MSHQDKEFLSGLFVCVAAFLSVFGYLVILADSI